uniref:Uncharacterized protein n=1 Tax=Panagrolaimus sp. JU765 TaxID=591449 RepID=A0AC34QDG1_9BILA
MLHFWLILSLLVFSSMALPFPKKSLISIDPENQELGEAGRFLVLKRPASNIRNCYFSPVQCLLPISDSTIRMFKMSPH